MKKNNVTIKDIAKALNVTPSTVSRALNGGGKISDKTKQSVFKLAKEWGYQPNLIAKNLQRKSSKTIGVIIPEFNHNFFSTMLHGIEYRARALGYQLMISSSGRKYDIEKKISQELANSKVDGLLIALSQDTEDYSFLNEIVESGIPIVLLDRICEDLDTSTVITDDFSGAFEAVSYLLDSGCSNILHLKGEEGISTTFNRYMGYVEAHKKRGLEVNSGLIIKHAEKEVIQQELKNTLKRVSTPDAIFACSDYLAFIALETVKSLGFKIPEDISIIGYADEPVSTYTSPKLSTVKQPANEIGRKAVDLLFDKEALEKPQLTLLETQLVLRESTL
ncbi:LacI family DNA-binding transcriptional regulator [Sediminitomix flava]|uniref:LacI family transcriptional regulator n=1 Tax=Sediminitomix flava TaxID=379075 RepID=A0A315YXZ6_SEDFL|nr:LacI family DNA-binding transcriptional regulator [Sediminitomix flava]PWJ35002.1 LacI family transcriptional regulator [Sediminitomix flava]